MELLRQTSRIWVWKLSTCLKRRQSTLRVLYSYIFHYATFDLAECATYRNIQSCLCGGICQHMYVCVCVIRSNHLSCRCWVSWSCGCFLMSGRFRGPLCLHHFMGQTLNIMRLLNTVTMTTDTECVWEEKEKSGNIVWDRPCVRETERDRETDLDVVLKKMTEFLSFGVTTPLEFLNWKRKCKYLIQK